ncbi:hypothetical protein SARC_00012 [Sphaeroforma arctica JP610]|uniref:Importin N-terminal domain-containing protein n=1 Tax=Sphaeroforma arctica JP610 TaxID=667725 RepID=A0A0L0GHP9_9EUKA|nr:hypothetical protein SARC_00012 [Sphaeroforma arctica JP610]KNC87878.1 hypothetical protein SARC_00012 [Sphaeroforma arctica JP610]|eukprot:XP_014161780.1 hypothetical protein SARC_00012 [Sphaeroforma arctica JP610]
MSIVTFLEHTLSANDNDRIQATQYLEQAAEANLAELLKALAEVIQSDNVPEGPRQAACISFKNHLTSKNETKKHFNQQRWLHLEAPVRAHIKNIILLSLKTPNTRVGAQAAQAVSAIAQAELPQSQWPELIPSLLQNCTDPQSPTPTKQNTLETVGFICEEIDPMVLKQYSNDILTAIVNGMRKDEPSMDVRLAATRAMLNSVDFVKTNMSNEAERNYIMQVVCETTQTPGNVQLRVRAMECLNRIVQLYYEFMKVYMQEALFQLTLQAMREDEDEVCLQAIEFWSTVCDEEMEIEMGMLDAQERSYEPERVSQYYARGALPHLVAILTELLCKQDESDDDADAWNVATASGVCLSLLSNCCRSDIVAPMRPFILGNITNASWHQREAAVLALGCILEGPDESHLEDIVSSCMSVLTQLMADPKVQVRDTCGWTIGRVFEYLPHVVLSENTNMNPLIQALGSALQDVPRVANNVCWTIKALADAAYDTASAHSDSDDVETYTLSPCFESLVQELLKTTERPDANNQLRVAAYECLNTVIQTAPNDCYAYIIQTTVSIMGRLEKALLPHDQLHSQDKQVHTEVQGLLCASLCALINKLHREDLMKISDQVMQILLVMLRTTDAQGVHEDALNAISGLISQLEEDFEKYMEHFKPFLLAGIVSSDYAIGCQSVGMTGDIARALGSNAQKYTDELMNQLLQALNMSTLPRNVRPDILSAFGDIATSIGPSFEKYLPFVMPILVDASNVPAPQNQNDYDEIEYVNMLRDSTLEAFAGIFVAMRGHPDTVSQYVAHVASFMCICANDVNHTDTMIKVIIGILGDLTDMYGKQMKPTLEQAWVQPVLYKASKSNCSLTKNTVEWAGQLIQKVLREN